MSNALVFRESDYKILHQLADEMEPRLRRAFLRAIRTQSLGTIDELLHLVYAENLPGALRALGIESIPDDIYESTAPLLRELLASAGNRTLQMIPGAAQAGLSFDIVNPQVLQWIADHVGLLITNITDDMRDGVKYVLFRGIRDGLPPDRMAYLIKDIVGLTERQSKALYNYAMKLHATGISPSQYRRQVDAYGKRLLEHRAMMIARTETISAANYGQLNSWYQAADAGLLNPARTERRWVVTPDDRLCPRCKRMKGKQVSFYDSFEEPDDIGGVTQTVMAPTLHPGCRCTTRLVFV